MFHSRNYFNYDFYLANYDINEFADHLFKTASSQLAKIYVKLSIIFIKEMQKSK